MKNKDIYVGVGFIVLLILFLTTVLVISVVTPKQCNEYTKYEYDKGHVPVRCIK